MGTLVPLQIDPHDATRFSNTVAFMNSLFDLDVRTLSPVTDAIPRGARYAYYADDNSVSLILQSWLAAWQHAAGDAYDHDAYARCPSSDRVIIASFEDYFKDHNLCMAVPDLFYGGVLYEFDGQYTRPQYLSRGYSWRAFRNSSGHWNYGEITSNNPLQFASGPYDDSTVLSFLHHLLCGAHFVIASDNDDQSNSNGFGNFVSAFTQDTSGQNRGTSSSHYVATISDKVHTLNTSCVTSPNITTDAEPSSGPLLVAAMCGNTTDWPSSTGNSFLQLEGWPAGGDRHNADYDKHLQTLWNFSTFGACVYSEKRSSPVFLGRSTFDLTIQTDTMMPHYSGAGSNQNWMHTYLIIT